MVWALAAAAASRQRCPKIRTAALVLLVLGLVKQQRQLFVQLSTSLLPLTHFPICEWIDRL